MYNGAVFFQVTLTESEWWIKPHPGRNKTPNTSPQCPGTHWAGTRSVPPGGARAPGWGWESLQKKLPAQDLFPPLSPKPSLNCQIPWEKARAGTTAAAKHLQTLGKVSVRLDLSTKRLFLHHRIQASILCHTQPSPHKHLEAFHGYVDISIMLHLNRFCCVESCVLLKYFPFWI